MSSERVEESLKDSIIDRKDKIDDQLRTETSLPEKEKSPKADAVKAAKTKRHKFIERKIKGAKNNKGKVMNLQFKRYHAP